MTNDIKKQQDVSHTSLSLKYSKSSTFYLSTKKDFFTENQVLLEKSIKHNLLYASQPKRELCKVCESPLPSSLDFHTHGVDYVFCSKCSHLNGMFEDTQEFIEKLYVSDSGSDYSNNYIDKDFYKRTTDIYIPKIDFLIASLPPKKYQILDVGCGSGYFVFAALLRNLNAKGLDVSKTMVNFGNHQISHQLNIEPLKLENEQGFYDSIIKSDVDVVSAIGVIEHLREPHKFFEAFKKSNADYLYYSVPMFSLSVILENIFTGVFPRQLSNGHTHLFTESSIRKMNELIGVKPVAEWRFGTDAMDLYRQTLITLQNNKSSQKLIDYLNKGYGQKIDEIQSIFDRHHFCSAVHCVAKKI
jgi:SAM-dependent methyltransferase